jgi:D-alanine-D-alanine ligase
MAKLKVALIFGGQSSEHEISIKSVTSINQVINLDKYDVVYIGITKKGAWVTGPSLERVVTKLDQDADSEICLGVHEGQPGLLYLSDPSLPFLPLDVAFPVLHGTFGEDGKIQGLFEMNSLPYVGCDVRSSVLGIDKDLQKIVLNSSGIPVVPHIAFTKFDWDQNQTSLLATINDHFDRTFPLIIKPANLGSSVGITKVSSVDQLSPAINHALDLDHKVIIEKCLEHPREIEVAVLGNHDPFVSRCGEIKTTHDFYSYDAKYNDDTSETFIPADLSQDLSQKIQVTALKAYQILGCQGLSRVDFFVDQKSDQFWLNEINTMPGFTSISMYPKLIEYSGIDRPKLIDRLIDLGLERAN